MLAGANDYRTVDLPGLPETKPSGDAWLGVFKSFDGGQSWKSSLLPGYPQDTSEVGTTSPLKGFDSGADATVRAGSNGLFFFSGIVFQRAVPVAASTTVNDGRGDRDDKESRNRKKRHEAKERKERKEKKEKKERAERKEREEKREQAEQRARKGSGDKDGKNVAREHESPPSPVRAVPEWEEEEEEEEEAEQAGGGTASAVFVSTYIDLNNQESGDPIRYVRTSIVDSDSGARFLDKQWTAVDIPRSNSSMCTFDVKQEDGSTVHQSFAGGRVYVAYTAFIGPESDGKAQILLKYSTDCGLTWSAARDISTVPDPDPSDDGIVNNVDLNMVKAANGKKCGEPGFNPAVDSNKDCVINLTDLTFISAAVGRTYSTVRRVPQGASFAINPANGVLSVVWREFKKGGLPDAIQYARSTDFGATFSAADHDFDPEPVRSRHERGVVPHDRVPDDCRRCDAPVRRVGVARLRHDAAECDRRRLAHRHDDLDERHRLDGACAWLTSRETSGTR